MAHPRNTKNSSLAAADRQAKKRPSVQVTDEEPGEILDDTRSEDTDGLDLCDSQDTTGEPLRQLIGTMFDGQRKRFDLRRKQVMENYSANCKRIQHSIDATFDEHEQKSSSAHKSRMDRLQDLLEQKARIEAAMAKKLEGLRAAYDAHSLDLEAVLNRKIKELD